MPALSNTKHEAFAKGIASGLSAEDAYAAAGYRPHRGNASTLRTNQNVRRRVAELQNKAAEKATWSAADRLLALKRISDAAEEKDPRVAVSAIAEANKMQGSHAPAKHQHAGPDGGPIQTVDLTHASADDLDRLEALFGTLAGAAGGDAEGDPSGEGETG